jgi:hypothetical protein
MITLFEDTEQLARVLAERSGKRPPPRSSNKR